MTEATAAPEETARGNGNGSEAARNAPGKRVRTTGKPNHRWLVRYGVAAVLLLVGLMQLVNGLALALYGTVATAPWQLLVGGGGSVTGDMSLTPEELKIEALVRLAVGALLIWPGGHLLRRMAGSAPAGPTTPRLLIWPGGHLLRRSRREQERKESG